MKKKIIFAVATGFFAVAAMFNMDMVKSNNNSDVSLENITMMAQASAESRSRFCFNRVTYGGISFARQCGSCTWAWFIGGGSGRGSC